MTQAILERGLSLYSMSLTPSAWKKQNKKIKKNTLIFWALDVFSEKSTRSQRMDENLISLSPLGVPVHGAACPGCTSSWWLSSCARGGPWGSRLGCQRRSGRCAWPRLSDPDSSGWSPCSSRPLTGKQSTESHVSSAGALRADVRFIAQSWCRK